MTKKDYEAIADVLHKITHETDDFPLIDMIVYELSLVFKADNPRFDRDKFVGRVYSGE